MNIRKQLRKMGLNLSKPEDLSVREAFGIASKVLFFVIMGGLAILAHAADGILAVTALGVIFAQFFYLLFPIQSIRETANSLLSGEAGRETYDEIEEQATKTDRGLSRLFNR